MRKYAAIAAVGLTACAHPTGEIIASVENVGKAARLRVCNVAIGWSETELTTACGPALRTIPVAGREGRQCAIYESGFVSTFQPAPYLAVCMSVEKGHAAVVDSIIGLARTDSLLQATTKTDQETKQ